MNSKTKTLQVSSLQSGMWIVFKNGQKRLLRGNGGKARDLARRTVKNGVVFYEIWYEAGLPRSGKWKLLTLPQGTSVTVMV